jgi:hypothetical protein
MLALRDHPLINYYGMKSWPPVWVNTHTVPTKKMTGETGVLIGAKFYPESPKRLFLRMEFHKQHYMGCLVFSDPGFCQQLNGILQAHLGHSIKEVGDLDLSDTL